MFNARACKIPTHLFVREMQRLSGVLFSKEFKTASTKALEVSSMFRRNVFT